MEALCDNLIVGCWLVDEKQDKKKRGRLFNGNSFAGSVALAGEVRALLSAVLVQNFDDIILRSCAGGRIICPAPCKLTVDLLTLKVVSNSRVMCATAVPILVFLGLSVLDLGPTYATDRRQTSDAYHRLMPPTLGAGHSNFGNNDVVSTKQL